MAVIEIKTQAALDRALKKATSGDDLRLIGKILFIAHLSGMAAPPRVEVMPGAKLEISSSSGGRVYVTAWENSTVTARENSTVTARENSTVTAWGNSTVTAWENSTVTAWGNSTVTAWGNSTVTARENSTVTARENSTVTAWGNSTVTARGYTFVRVFKAKKVDASANVIVALHVDPSEGAEVVGVGGGRQLICPLPTTGAAWCDHYGVEVTDGVATLYKGVHADYRSPRGGDYTPGTIPSVPAFLAEPECGPGALYFSPTPSHTRRFIDDPAHFLACPVRVEDIVTHPRGSYPEKVKAKGCCAPVYEVDEAGKPIAPAEGAAIANATGASHG